MACHARIPLGVDWPCFCRGGKWLPRRVVASQGHKFSLEKPTVRGKSSLGKLKKEIGFVDFTRHMAQVLGGSSPMFKRLALARESRPWCARCA